MKISIFLIVIFTLVICINLVNAVSVGNQRYTLYHGHYNVLGNWVDEPIHLNQVPILLVPGWNNKASCQYENWGYLENDLKANYDVWNLEYCPANLSTTETAGLISWAISDVLSHYTTSKLDVVAYSNGGPAVMAYIKHVQGVDLVYQNNIRNFITLDSPLGGSYLANIIDGKSSFIQLNNNPTCNNFVNNYNLQGNTEATRDMEFGSDFVWNLNSIPLNTDIKYLTIAGSMTGDQVIGGFGDTFGLSQCASNKGEINDGIVSASSSLLLYQYPLVSFDIINVFHNLPGLAIDLGYSNNVAYTNEWAADDIQLMLNGYSKTISIPTELQNNGALIIKQTGTPLYNLQIKNSHTNQIYTLEHVPGTSQWVSITFNNIQSFTTLLPIGNYFIIPNNYQVAPNPSNDEVNILNGRINLKQICVANWFTQDNYWTYCNISDLKHNYYVDLNSCPEAYLINNPPATLTANCNFCSYSLINTSWSGWNNLTCSGSQMNQSRNLIQYDKNYSTCYAVTGLAPDYYPNQTFYDYKLVGPIYQNSTFGNWINITSCLPENYYIQSRNLTQFDSYGCASNQTLFDFRNQTCSYCIPNIQNTSFSNWTNVVCSGNNLNQSRFNIEYDTNNCNKTENITHWEYQSLPPVYLNTSYSNWEDDSSCRSDNTKLQIRNLIQYDNQSCAINITLYDYQEVGCSFNNGYSGGGGGGCSYNTNFNWNCSIWSGCITGKQTRVCKKYNNCGTTYGKPNETQSCTVIDIKGEKVNQTEITTTLNNTDITPQTNIIPKSWIDKYKWLIIFVFVLVILFISYKLIVRRKPKKEIKPTLSKEEK